MRHFRGSRGGRRGNMPRNSTRSSKFIVDEASASETTGLQVFQMAIGEDNATLGQTSAVDTGVPTGSKITKLDIRCSYASLVNVATFIHWAIELRLSGQASLNPLAQGGNPLRTIVMLSGIRSVGQNQNQDIHIVYKIPPKFQRMKDGAQWQWTTNNSQITTAVKQVVYKVYQ